VILERVVSLVADGNSKEAGLALSVGRLPLVR
jgi:hypothetical protein